MTRWRRRLLSRRWLGAWRTNERSGDIVIQVLLVIYCAGVFAILRFSARTRSEQSLVLEIGLLVVAFITLSWSTGDRRKTFERRREEHRHRRRVEHSLNRIGDLLEAADTKEAPEPVLPARRRHRPGHSWAMWSGIVAALAVTWSLRASRRRR